MVIVSVEGTIVSVRLTDLVCCGLLESFTWKVSGVFVTLTVGVPAMAPVEALSKSPVGNVPLVRVHVKGEVPPVAASVVL